MRPRDFTDSIDYIQLGGIKPARTFLHAVCQVFVLGLAAREHDSTAKPETRL